MNVKYMHTMNGKPAYFDPKKGEIFFAGRGWSAYNAVRLVDSVKEIHCNERKSAKTRKKLFGAKANIFEMSWVNVMA